MQSANFSKSNNKPSRACRVAEFIEMPVPCALDLACPYCQLLPQPESMPWNFANMRTVPEKRWRWHKDADAELMLLSVCQACQSFLA